MLPEADALYALPPAEFTAARDALAARLRADGRRDEAAEVRALRRPTTAAAALNLTVRAHPEALAELLSAGRNLARAQERLVAGHGDRAVLREASEHVREAISALAAAATGDHGLSPATADLVRETLQAALVDEAVRDALAAGRLQREAQAGGVGFPPAGTAAPTPAAGGARAKPGGAGSRRTAAAQEEAAAAREEAARRKEAAERLRAAGRAVRELERRLEQAVRRAQRTAASVEDLRSRLAAAQAEADGAEHEAEALRAELRHAKSEEAAAAEDVA